MFDDTLLDSSAKRLPVLRPVHWWIGIGVGLAAFVLGYFSLGLVFSGTEGGALITQSIIMGVVLAFYALILCYTWTDAQHIGVNKYLWFAIVFVLNIVGFILYLIFSASKSGDWKRATMPIAYMFEAVLISVVLIYPLMYTQTLPQAQLMTMLMAPPPPPPPPPPAAPAPKVIIHRVSTEDLLRAPTVIPKTIQQVRDQPAPPQSAGVVGGVPGGVPGGSMGGVIGGMIGAPPPPPPPKPATPKRITIGGQVEAAKCIFEPQPEYPQIAKMARVQGTVRLAAVISEGGTIQELRVISGPPLLVNSAMEAVRRWRYQPTLLNGEPVQVDTEIDVNFTLQE
ncbi:MAG TPA: TonB family protein [Terriglobia bacterium]|nr:TonB family protein [Terriglobia bacterium]